MSALSYSSLKIYSRQDFKKTIPTISSKSSLLLPSNTETINFSYGLQGSGKFTDNAFKTSLRNDSSHAIQRLSRSKEPSTPNECLSARSLKMSLVAAKEIKCPGRPDIGGMPPRREVRSKENKGLKTASSLAMLLKKKPKLEGDNNNSGVLKESNRELGGYKKVKGPQFTSMSTEQDSFTSHLKSPTVDINQQLRNIFQVGTEKVNNDEDYGYPIPEEHQRGDGVKARIFSASCPRKLNSMKLVHKF